MLLQETPATGLVLLVAVVRRAQSVRVDIVRSMLLLDGVDRVWSVLQIRSVHRVWSVLLRGFLVDAELSL